MPVGVKWACAIGALVFCAWGAQRGGSMAAPAVAGRRSAVVVELFTSEGCSSCPPADDALSPLVRQPANDVEVLALGEHVDYWDRLGWRDPFSSPAYLNRQSTYDAGVFRRHDVYTPQLVIDGRFEVVATALPKAAVEVTVSRRHDRELDVDVRVDVPPALTLRESVDVLIAVTEDNLQSEVRRGENRGRTLRHSAVVRSLASVGTLLPQDRAWSTKTSVVLAPEWTPANVRVVSFLQEGKSHHIVGGGATRLSADAPTGRIE